MITTQQLQLLKEGNKNAFEALYRAYNAAIFPEYASIVSTIQRLKSIFISFLQ